MANNKAPEEKWSEFGKGGYPLMGHGLKGYLPEFVRQHGTPQWPQRTLSVRMRTVAF
jgi:hypothetical protein